MTNYDFLAEKYNRDKWKELIRSLFPAQADVFAHEEAIPMDNERIESFVQFGTVRINDQYDTQLALFEIRLNPGTTKLQINRVALNKIVSQINENAMLTGALAVYVDDEKGKWRFSFIAKRQQYNQSGELEKWETEPKRYTYVFGKGERTLTAKKRFELLTANTLKTLDDIAAAFSVEKIGDEFFKKYKEHYLLLCNDLYSNHDAAALFDDQKAMRDFVKKLMGRLVFLYFLQKKGWLGAQPPDPLKGEKEAGWHNGDFDFIARLFRESPEQAKFHSQELRRLFYHTLNERRKGDLFKAPWGEVRVPYLNGGLFDDDLPQANDLDFAPERFTALFDFFNAYNFTVDENSPNDHEVGIDPEMLGHIFENLLEENKEKGAYYTPKEIVHYMCQESLLQYLKTELLGEVKPKDVVWSDSRAHDEAELTDFVRHKQRGSKDNFIHKNARAIEKRLRDVRICDPAIGSGAFPMGLLHEVFFCQVELDLTEDYAALKKDIIHHCIYGVDKDKGAVDIARLRFWLSLVVDEETPQELPNLDYKIMQGDSLLESFEGIDLSQLIADEQEDKPLKKPTQGSLFAPTSQQTLLRFEGEERDKLVALMDKFFDMPDKAEKESIHQKIEGKVNSALNKGIRKTKNRLDFDQAELKKQLENQSLDLKKRGKILKEIARLEAEIEIYGQKEARLDDAKRRPEKPWFLWNLYFRDVFDRGGFDIVIGNPPYVQLQKLGKYTDTLQAAGFETFARTADLYCLFYEKAIRILRHGGVMAYITSNSWLKTQYGEHLRRYFTNHTTPLALLNFEDAQIFKAAIVEANILLAQKGLDTSPMQAVAIGKDYLPGQPLTIYLQEKGTPVTDLTAEAWHIGDAKAVALKAKIEGKRKKLKDWDIEIFRGILTGFNKAFLISEEDKTALPVQDDKLLKPILRGRDLEKYGFCEPKNWLMFTSNGYLFNKDEQEEYVYEVDGETYFDKGGVEYKVFREEPRSGSKIRYNRVIVSEDYPALIPYFEQYEKELKKREDQGDHWTNLRNCDYAYAFELPKIIWSEISDMQKFSYDENGCYTNNKCYIMIGKQLKYLQAILNSRVAGWYFNQISSTTGMGTMMWAKYKIEQLPIASASDEEEGRLERLVERVLAGKRSGGETGTWEAKIDALVMRLYGLNEEEMGYLLGSLPTVGAGERTEIRNNFRDLERGTFNEEQ